MSRHGVCGSRRALLNRIHVPAPLLVRKCDTTQHYDTQGEDIGRWVPSSVQKPLRFLLSQEGSKSSDYRVDAAKIHAMLHSRLRPAGVLSSKSTTSCRANNLSNLALFIRFEHRLLAFDSIYSIDVQLCEEKIVAKWAGHKTCKTLNFGLRTTSSTERMHRKVKVYLGHGLGNLLCLAETIHEAIRDTAEGLRHEEARQ
ncbi:hypothetical protein F5883DRAFT_571837 [Diaporthe sp. PMI_573]|nr:hypothetical protein F5883DRAFT_571837 [Diaporthaceae sp. PMI_573]